MLFLLGQYFSFLVQSLKGDIFLEIAGIMEPLSVYIGMGAQSEASVFLRPPINNVVPALLAALGKIAYLISSVALVRKHLLGQIIHISV